MKFNASHCVYRLPHSSFVEGEEEEICFIFSSKRNIVFMQNCFQSYHLLSIKDQGRCSKQIKRWSEHYQEFKSRETTISYKALENTTQLTITKELDATPTTEELGLAIDFLLSGNSTGCDDIPPDSLLLHLHELLLQCSAAAMRLCAHAHGRHGRRLCQLCLGVRCRDSCCNHSASRFLEEGDDLDASVQRLMGH